MEKSEKKLAIRFGLGAIKAVGIGMMESAITKRNKDGEFKDIFDFCQRLEAKTINKKSIEALAKSGAFDCLEKNRRQIHDSFDILSRYAAQKSDEVSSNQMSLFSGVVEEKKPELKKAPEWTKTEKLQKEFEAFGFFLNEHPLDDSIDDLKKRGIIFSKKIETDELQDNWVIKMAGVVAASKHRSSSRGRFAYVTMSDPFGIYEILIFDEELITRSRDLLENGQVIIVECLIRKDDGGTRLLVREITKLSDFLKNVKANNREFEDIQKLRKRNNDNERKPNPYLEKEKAQQKNYEEQRNKMLEQLKTKKIYSTVEIIIKEREGVLNAKSFLSQKLVAQDFKKYLNKTTKVYFSVMNGAQINKIALEEDYLLDEFDVRKIKETDKIIDVEVFS